MVERLRKLLRDWESKANWEWNAILLGNMNRKPSFFDFVTLRSRSTQAPLSLCYSWMKKAKIILLNDIAILDFWETDLGKTSQTRLSWLLAGISAGHQWRHTRFRWINFFASSLAMAE